MIFLDFRCIHVSTVTTAKSFIAVYYGAADVCSPNLSKELIPALSHSTGKHSGHAKTNMDVIHLYRTETSRSKKKDALRRPEELTESR